MQERYFFTTEELLAVPRGDVFFYDVESFQNYFLVGFKHMASGKYAYFESIGAEAPVQGDWLQYMIDRFCVVGFNSISYDIVIISMAIAGNCSVADLKDATEEIIVYSKRPNDLARDRGFLIQKPNHVDLIEVAPLTGSLKLYAARLHCQHMQDLPFHPDTILTREEISTVRTYNFNDLDNTELLAKELHKQLELRFALSTEYRQDLRSKSDAQIAEAVIIASVKEITGKPIKRPKIDTEKIHKYRVPSWMAFETPELKNLLEDVRNADFQVNEFGFLEMPTVLEGRTVKLGETIYRLGIGGLHSSESCVAHYADDLHALADIDVESYYPKIILTLGLFPEHIGPDFLTVYAAIVAKRLAAKKIKDMVTSDSLKITINGSFGKLGSPYSDLYSPELLLQVTVTGQLALLMLIEQIELHLISVVSGNTDGILVKYRREHKAIVDYLVEKWEALTGFKTEEAQYMAIYSRDVNNYIAVKTDGKTKAKGEYSEFGSAGNSRLSKNPVALIATDAAIAYIASEKPVLETIRECQQIQRFSIVRNVKGGAQKDGKYLGKTVRWYYAEGVRGSIVYCKSGNKVANSDGGKPLMTLPASFPTDIDFAKYEDLAISILEDVGQRKRRNQQLTFV